MDRRRGGSKSGKWDKILKDGRKKKHLEKNYRQKKKREGHLHSEICEEFSPPSRRCSKLPRDPNSEKLRRKCERVSVTREKQNTTVNKKKKTRKKLL
jgi:hypothetical protein